MTPDQRAAALRLVKLAEKWADESGQDITEEVALLRELAREPVQEPVCWGWRVPDGRITAIFSERKDNPDVEVVALYAAPQPQGEPVAWIDSNGHPHHLSAVQTVTERRLYGPWKPVYAHPPQAEPVRECADNDSPWLVCKTCAAVGRCAKQDEPVAWRSKERINGEFDSGWKLTSNEPPQTPRTIAIEPLYTHPPQQRPQLTDEQIRALVAQIHGVPWLTVEQLIRAVERAHGIKEAP